MNPVLTLALDEVPHTFPHTHSDVADIGVLAATLVGTRGVDEVIQEIRHSMLAEALSRSQGNRTHAANLLGVTRQAVQQMLGRYAVEKPLKATG